MRSPCNIHQDRHVFFKTRRRIFNANRFISALSIVLSSSTSGKRERRRLHKVVFTKMSASLVQKPEFQSRNLANSVHINHFKANISKKGKKPKRKKCLRSIRACFVEWLEIVKLFCRYVEFKGHILIQAVSKYR